MDDREIYTAYRRYARQWLAELAAKGNKRWESKGLHLVFSGGHSQLGMTYVSDASRDGAKLWERRYAISIAGDRPEERGEAGLVFGVELRGDTGDQLRRFCHLAPLFDTLATSARYVSTHGAEAARLHLAIALARVAWVTAAALTLGWGTDHLWPSSGLALLALVAGFSPAELAVFVVWPLYRRLLWTWQPIADDAAPRSSYERFSTELVFWLLTLPAQILAYAARALGSSPRSSIAGRTWGVAALAGLVLTSGTSWLPLAPLRPSLAITIGGFLGSVLALVGARLYVEMKQARVRAG